MAEAPEIPSCRRLIISELGLKLFNPGTAHGEEEPLCRRVCVTGWARAGLPRGRGRTLQLPPLHAGSFLASLQGVLVGNAVSWRTAHSEVVLGFLQIVGSPGVISGLLR